MSAFGNLWKILTCVIIAAVSFVALFWPRHPQASDLSGVTSVARETQSLAKIKATARPDEFAALVQQALARSPWAFGALRDIAKENKIDLTAFFPDLKIDIPFTDSHRRNAMLLEYLIRQVGVNMMATIEIESGAGGLSGLSAAERTAKLEKVEDIIRSRLSSFGVSNKNLIIGPAADGTLKVVVLHEASISMADMLQKQWLLEMRLVHPYLTPANSPETPIGYERMAVEEKRNGQSFIDELYVKRRPKADGRIITHSFPSRDTYGKAEIVLKFTPEGRKKFARITKAMADENAALSAQLGRQLPPSRLAIVLDGTLYSAPQVRQEIDSDSAVITGNFADMEAQALSTILNNPLDIPIRLTELREVSVPASVHQLVSGAWRTALYAIMIIAALMAVWFVIAAIRENLRKKHCGETPPPIPAQPLFQP